MITAQEMDARCVERIVSARKPLTSARVLLQQTHQAEK
jgi:hypothetical protein